jgi:hypothetical protein
MIKKLQGKEKIRTYGSAKGELILIDPWLISFRLANGEFIGPRVGLHDDGKMHVLLGESPLSFSEELIAAVSGESGWNTRVSYDLDSIVDLADKIVAARAIYQPLHLIADGDRLFPKDGHRRTLAWLYNAARGIEISNVIAIIKTLARGQTIRDLEYEMLSMGVDAEKLSLLDRAKMIRRHLREDCLSGLTEEQSKAQFCERTGWKKTDYNRVLEISTFSAPVLKAIEEKGIAETTLQTLMRESELTLPEKEKIILESVSLAEEAGAKKVTGSIIGSVAENHKKRKRPTFIKPSGEVKTPDEMPVKPVQLPPKAKEIREMFIKLVGEGNARKVGDSYTVDFSAELWEKVVDLVERLK